MHCLGWSKIAVEFGIQLAKLLNLKVILQQLCTNSASSGPAGEFELLDKCTISIWVLFVGNLIPKLLYVVGCMLLILSVYFVIGS